MKPKLIPYLYTFNLQKNYSLKKINKGLFSNLYQYSDNTRIYFLVEKHFKEFHSLRENTNLMNNFPKPLSLLILKNYH